jgi:TP901 family phage tail tape measure protein
MAKKHRLEILAVLRDELSIPLKRINKALNLTSTGSRKVATSSKGAARGLDKVGRSAGTATRRTSVLYQTIKRLSRGLSNLKFLAGAAITAFGVYAWIRVAKSIASTTIEVEKLNAEISTLLGDVTQGQIENMSFAIRHMAVQGGQTLKDEFSAAYDAISAGMPRERLLEFLEAANKLAVGGVTDVSTATNLLTSVMNSFGLEMDEMDDVLDSLFQTVKFGKLRISDLANSIGRVAPIAEKAGLSLHEMNAAIATLTISGLKTEEATTALRQLLATLIDLPPIARKRLKEMGLEQYFSLSRMRQVGFTAFIVDLAKMVEGREEELAGFIGNIRALTGALSLVNNKGETLLKIMEGFSKRSGAAQKAFERLQGTLGFALDRLKALIEAVKTDIGNVIFVGLADQINTFVDAVETARVVIKNIKDEMGIGGIDPDRLEVLEERLNEVIGALKGVVRTAIGETAKLFLFLFLESIALIGRELGEAIFDNIGAALMRLENNFVKNFPKLAWSLGFEDKGRVNLSSTPGVAIAQLKRLIRDLERIALLSAEGLSRWGEIGARTQPSTTGTGQYPSGKNIQRQLAGLFSDLLKAWGMSMDEFNDVITEEGSVEKAVERLLTGTTGAGLGPVPEMFNQKTIDRIEGIIAARGPEGMADLVGAATWASVTVADNLAEQYRKTLKALQEQAEELDAVLGLDLKTVLEEFAAELDNRTTPATEKVLETIDALLRALQKAKDEGISLQPILDIDEQEVVRKLTDVDRAIQSIIENGEAIDLFMRTTAESLKAFAEEIPRITAEGYISILDALGLKDESRIATASEELRKLNVQLNELLETRKKEGGKAVGDAFLTERAELVYLIQAKELEHERLIIAQKLNRAKSEFRMTMAALKAGSQAGTITPLEFKVEEQAAIETYNQSIQDQQNFLVGLITLYPQWSEELLMAAANMDSLKQATREATGAVGGLKDAWTGFTKGLGASENAFASVGQAMGNRLGAAIDGLIMGTKTLGQAFKEMAIGIIQDIAKIIVKMLILKALDMMFFGGAPVASGAAGASSYNRGGRVRGFSHGGYLSRFGPDRDSIPAMLTPGEFVIRRSAVDKYGTGLLSMINSMMAPSNLSGMAKSAANYRGNVQGFNTGGEVPGGVGRAEVPQPAYIVANERSMQSLLTGGKSAMLEFLRQNRGAFSGNARGGSR